MRSAERYRHRKSASFFNGAIDFDCAFMKFDELQHQGKADSAAFIGAALLPLDAMETLEQTRELVVRNTSAAVADAQFAWPSSWRRRTAIPPSKVNLNALERRLSTIFSHMSRST